MTFNNCTFNGDTSAESRENEYLESRSIEPEKRQEKRLDFIRPVLYLCYGANQFLDGTILNYSDGGICLHTAFPVEPLIGIYVAVRRKKNASFHYKTGEYGFARAVWCRMKEGAYRIGIRWVSDSLNVQKFEAMGYRGDTSGGMWKPSIDLKRSGETTWR